MTTVQMTTPAISSAQSLAMGEAIRSKALSFAAKTGAAIDAVVIATADAKDIVSLTPVKLRAAMIANLSEDELNELPLPGSRWKNKDGTPNNNADIGEWKDPSKGPDAKPREISFYITWADGTPEGNRVVTELEYIKCVSTEGMRTDHIPAEWIAQYSGNPTAIKRRKKYLDGRRATVRKAYKDTVRLIWQFDMVNELKGCEAEVEDGESTVIVVNKAKPRSEWRVMSVGAFLKLNVQKALEQDGSYAALIATAERKKQPNPTPGAKPGLAVNAIATPDTLDKAMIMVHSYLDKCMSDKNGTDYGSLLKHLTGAGNGQSVLTLWGIKKELDTLFRIDALAVTAQRLEDDTNKATKAA